MRRDCAKRLLEKKDSNLIRKEKLKSATISTRTSAYTATVVVSQSQPNSASSSAEVAHDIVTSTNMSAQPSFSLSVDQSILQHLP